MFVMTNDGGSTSDDQIKAGPILCQRAFIFDIMTRSIPIALLRGAVFRDSKVASPLCFLQTPHPSFRIDCHIHLRARANPRPSEDSGQGILGSRWEGPFPPWGVGAANELWESRPPYWATSQRLLVARRTLDAPP